MLTVEDGHVADHVRQFTVVCFFNDGGESFFVFLFLEIDEFQFAQFVGRERIVNGSVERLGDPFLAKKIVSELIEHLEYVKQLHRRDIKSGYSGAFMFGLLEKNIRIAQGNWSGSGSFLQTC